MPPKKINPTRHDDVPVNDPTALEPDGQPVAAPERPRWQVDRDEKEKAALLEAMRLPAPRSGIATRKPIAEVRISLAPKASAPVLEQGQTVDAAEAEHQAALVALETAKASLEQSERDAVEARSRAAQIAAASARDGARTKLAPLMERVRKQRAALLGLHQQYGGPSSDGMVKSNGPLGEMARSIASGDSPVRRAKIQSLYSAAGPMAQRIALGYAVADEALRLAERILSGHVSAEFNTTVAVQKCERSLELDVKALGEACARLVAECNAWRQPGYHGPAVEKDTNSAPETGWKL